MANDKITTGLVIVLSACITAASFANSFGNRAFPPSQFSGEDQDVSAKTLGFTPHPALVGNERENNVSGETRIYRYSESEASDQVKSEAAPEALPSGDSVCAVIGTAARAHRLPASFLTQLIWQESRFDPHAVSHAGAQGIAQFMPGTARWRGLTDPFDPHTAIYESARWLSELRKQFGNLGLAAAAYNAGPQRVLDWLAGRRTLPGETRVYVKRITGAAAEAWALPGAKDDPKVDDEPKDCQRKSLRLIAYGPAGKRETATRPDKERTQRGAATAPPAWSLQLIGDRSETKALAEYKKMQQRFPHLLGTREPIVMKRKLGGRLPVFWFQVRVAEVSRPRADALCAQLRSAGGQCLVLSN